MAPKKVLKVELKSEYFNCAKVQVQWLEGSMIIHCVGPECFEAIFTIHRSDLVPNRPPWHSRHTCRSCGTKVCLSVTDTGVLKIVKWIDASKLPGKHS